MSEKILVLGLSKSGIAAAKLGISLGYDVYLTEGKAEVNELQIKELQNLDIKVEYGSHSDEFIKGSSFVVTSPGIPPKSDIFKRIQKENIPIISEVEFAYLNSDTPFIAITGTNGKTTTISLLSFILSGNKNIFVGGNIGTPVTSFTTETKDEDIILLECSSYQLESIKKFSPHIAGILNITEDHLIRHKTMKNYIKAKFNITKNQTEKDYLLINFDSEILMQNLPKTRAKIYYFSIKEKVIGCYIKNDSIYFNDGLKEKKLVSLKNIKLVGNHNLSNILCAVLAVYLELNEKKLLTRISQFQGVKHRIEFVKNIEGISFYNDSKATNIDSTLVAVNSFKSEINLILGGSEKGYEFDKLFKNLPNNVKNIIVFGQTKQKIIDASKRNNFSKIHKCTSLKECVMLGYKLSKKGDIVLLSPACASFDHFKNFEERGNVFIKIVKEIDDGENSLFGVK